ncbi:hypothetical protein EsH8_IX_000523 [Colletotrichum jinshuiense]
MTFHLFGDLPPEIRAAIWKLSLPEDEPEVCIAQSTSDTSQCMVVYTAYPVLMHVCRESRHFVQHFNLSGIRFTTPETTCVQVRCPVPFRSFRPDLDTLFCQNRGPAAVEDLSDNISEPILDETLHLAITGEKEYLDLVAWVITFYFPKLETLSVVVDDPSRQCCFDTYFEAPTKRCKLRRISDKHSNMTSIIGANKLADTGTWEPICLADCMAEYTQELEKIVTECFESMDTTLRELHKWWNHESRSIKKLKYLTETFIEYEADGLFRHSEFVETDVTRVGI